MTTKKDKENNKLLPIRLSFEGDEMLREGNRRHGDLSRRILEAIMSVDLATVEVGHRDRTPGSGKVERPVTSVHLPNEIYALVKQAAAARKISMSVLIDGAVRKHFAPATMQPAQ